MSHIISLGHSPPKHSDGTASHSHFNTHHNDSDDEDVIHITTQSCREGGAGTTIQHLTLFHNDTAAPATSTTPPHNTSPTSTTTTARSYTATPSFLLSRDNGTTYHYGSLPQQLHRRIIQEQTMKNTTKTATTTNQSPTYYMDNIIYLSTGPYGTYYVEFRNSEKWWGIVTNCPDNSNPKNGTNRLEVDQEDEFNTICYDWDIHRVAFGPCTIQQRSTNRKSSKAPQAVPFISLSWIIISKDGKVAWKNIPLRLHNCLSNRIASDSTPCEVSLGANGSYFIRFIDGTSDWSLPAKTARVCQNLIHNGKTILSMSLHPDLSNDFIIRHR